MLSYFLTQVSNRRIRSSRSVSHDVKADNKRILKLKVSNA